MKKPDALFPILLGFDLALTVFLPIPIISHFVCSVIMSFFFPIIGWKKTFLINFTETVLHIIHSPQGLIWVATQAPFYLPIIMIIYFIFIPVFTTIGSFVEYLINRKLFKKWFKLIEEIR